MTSLVINVAELLSNQSIQNLLTQWYMKYLTFYLVRLFTAE